MARQVGRHGVPKRDVRAINDERARRSIKPSGAIPKLNVGMEAEKLVRLYGSRDKAKQIIDDQLASLVYDASIDAFKYRGQWFNKSYVNQVAEIGEAIARSHDN